eukprot:7685628-Pyramimonas_sp.AAC.1
MNAKAAITADAICSFPSSASAMAMRAATGSGIGNRDLVGASSRHPLLAAWLRTSSGAPRASPGRRCPRAARR